jgi:hypothetical protein
MSAGFFVFMSLSPSSSPSVIIRYPSSVYRLSAIIRHHPLSSVIIRYHPSSSAIRHPSIRHPQHNGSKFAKT